jgi:hypothetical protein
MRSIKSYRGRLLALLLALTFALAGCSGAAGTGSSVPSESSTPTESTGQTSEPAGGDMVAAINTGVFTTSYEYTEDDMNASWDKNQATSVTLNGNSA